MLMEREGNWTGALAAYDLALHGQQQQLLQPAWQGSSSNRAAATPGSSQAAMVHLGVARALGRFGTGAAAATYLKGAGKGCRAGGHP